MKKGWIVTLFLPALLVLAVSAGPGIGQEDERERVEPEAVMAGEAIVSAAFTYQGTLAEGGNPVDGPRDMVFTLYSNSNCSTVVQTINRPGVPVVDGRFQVQLPVDASHFNGQALWVAPTVGGTRLGCQEIAPVPYALSLRPGATISDGNTSAKLNESVETASGTARAGVAGTAQDSPVNVGVRGIAGGTTGARIGVYGYGPGNGAGGVFQSDSGIALLATGSGRIQSTAETQISVNPNAIIATSDNVYLIPADGPLTIRPTAVSAVTNVFVPTHTPSMLYGVPTKLKSIEVCYRVTNPDSYINILIVSAVGKDGSGNHLILDSTDLKSTSWACHTASAGTPEVVSGPLSVWLSLTLGGIGGGYDIHVGAITLTLVE